MSLLGCWLRFAFCLLISLASPWALALDSDYLRQLVPVAEKNIRPYGEDMFGEKVSLYDGSLQFEQTDLDLKGNNDLPVRLSRRLVVGKTGTSYLNSFPVGNWQWNLPRVGGSFSKAEGWQGVVKGSPAVWGGNRCTGYTVPNFTFDGYDASDIGSFWQGMFLEVPEAGRQELLKRTTSYTAEPDSGGPYPIVTKQQWQVGCLSATKNGTGEGFFAISPAGVRYDFDWMVQRDIDAIRVSGGSFARQDVYLYASKVTDRYGNWVSYTFDPANPEALQSITSSDGREITITTSGKKALSATDGTRTYTYAYASGTALTSVTLPDGRQWLFDLGAMYSPSIGIHVPNDEACPDGWSYAKGGPFTGTITHPTGATGTFTISYSVIEVPDTPATCNLSNGAMRYDIMPSRAALGLSKKVISGVGLETQTWTYQYAQTGTTPCASLCSYTNVTNPDGTVTRHVFGNSYRVNEGRLLYVLNGWDGTSALQTTAHTYRVGGSGQAFPDMFGQSLFHETGDWWDPFNVPTESVTITRDGASFSSVVNTFDANARAVTVTKSGTGGSRSETTSYLDNTALWVLGAVTQVTSNGLVVQAAEYDSLVRPMANWAFGVLKGRQTYNADGTVATKVDPAGRVLTLSNYKRGHPQNLGLPTGASETAEINNIGLLTSYSDALGNKTAFTYDEMGRLASILPPGGYTSTTVTFGVADEEYGLPAGHWRQTVSKGAARTITLFDAMWRPVLQRVFDISSATPTQKVVTKTFDTQNRVTFESYPVREILDITTSVLAGKHTTFDAIGRPVKVEADSEIGTLATTIEYLSGFKVRETNPRGNATTRTMWSLEDPDEASISLIQAPLGDQVSVVRDAFGKPTSITRNGVTRSYVYDAGQRLCKTIEPEVASTVQAYDTAGNVAWRAPGQALPDTGSCNTDSVAASAKIAYTYDELGQLLTTTYGDGSPSVTRSYTNDGKLESVASNGSTWAYDYNPLRLLSSEILNFNGQQYAFGWNYDSLGNLASLAYPDGTTVAYSSNALGEATAVGSFASGVAYHPNGMVSNYTFGNGIQHSLTLNTRGLPLVNLDAGVTKDQYTYDQNGNVSAIQDQQWSVFDRVMTYDELDRLKTANASGVWGSASYTYDAVDNITSATVGSRSSTMSYDGRNRLSSMLTNGALYEYAYDEQGNIRSKGNQTYGFDLGNRLTSSNLGGSYQYDGHGRRTMVQGKDGSTRVQVYSQGGQLLWADANEPAPVVAATITGYSCSAGTQSGSSCVSTSTYAATPHGYACNSGDTLSGTTCTHVVTTTYAASVASYSCASGDVLSGSSCSRTAVTSTYAATPVYVCTSGDTLSGSTCTHVTTVAATPVYSCPSGYTLSATTCSRTTTTAATVASYTCNGLTVLAVADGTYECTGTARTSSDETYQDRCDLAFSPYGLDYLGSTVSGTKITCYYLAKMTYACPTGATLSGSSCVSTATQAATIASYTCSSGSVSGSSCVSTSTYGASLSAYSCTSGDSLSGSTCSHSTTTTYSATPSYACNSGDSLSGSTCTNVSTSTYSATINAYACNSGDTLSGSACTHTTSAAATPIYSCSSGTLSGSSCVGSATHTNTMYVYLGSKQIAEVQNGVTQYAHMDALGSPVAHTSPAGGILNQSRFEPYGYVAQGTKPSKGTSVLGFAGHVQDSETDLVYMQQRYYDPIAGLFLSVDPVVADVSSGLGFNRYVYGRDNPYSFVDPNGKFAVWIHWGVTYLAAQSAGYGFRESIHHANRAWMADWEAGSQAATAGAAARHAMRIPGTTREEAAELNRDLVSAAIARGDLGLAAHATQDRYAAGHADYALWEGFGKLGILGTIKHIWEDMFPSAEELGGAYQATKSLLGDAKKASAPSTGSASSSPSGAAVRSVGPPSSQGKCGLQMIEGCNSSNDPLPRKNEPIPLINI